MTLSIDLPAPLEEELKLGAKREGVTVSDQAAFLLELMTTMTKSGRKTRFRSVVEGYFRQNAVDADRLADLMHGLISVCLHDSGKPASSDETSSAVSWNSMDDQRVLLILQGWRQSELSREEDSDVVINSLPPLEHLIQQMGRMNRDSILGKYAYLGGGSEEFLRSKQEEIDREDRL